MDRGGSPISQLPMTRCFQRGKDWKKVLVRVTDHVSRARKMRTSIVFMKDDVSESSRFCINAYPVPILASFDFSDLSKRKQMFEVSLPNSFAISTRDKVTCFTLQQQRFPH
ncbi:hypothetical protein TNCV_3993451 [Trichonephila clavipes]|uniref:Uncharacterized protein n=1 Tax=Trichonephila clavipes TaxID=2585209 RepID=A0A8X6T005_TRICX|nr:hypothetical protein TNCV_3993451 [Trichonephila clavipes]